MQPCGNVSAKSKGKTGYKFSNKKTIRKILKPINISQTFSYGSYLCSCSSLLILKYICEKITYPTTL